MKSNYMAWIGAGALSLLLLGGAAVLPAQGQEKPSLQKEKQQTGTPAQGAQATPPVNAEEEAAYKAYVETPATDGAKRAQLGEDFVQKYPQSRYNPVVYSGLAAFYYSMGNIKKLQENGVKAVELNPNDVQVLAILGQTMPRALSRDPAEAAKQLAQAEQYAKRALEVTPTLPKPPNLTEENFASAKNVVQAMAHSGLGLVDIHRQKFSEAILELEQAVKLDTQPDSVNYYLLGLANEKASHFDDAVASYTKCAALPGQMQATCKSAAEAAKKLAATQLSAPK